MVGQGVLREALLDPAVTQVITVGRTATGKQHAKLREISHANLYDLTSISDQLTALNACLFCLGVSAAGMKEVDYRHVTYDLTIAVAKTLLITSPELTFVYVSGTGTDSSETGGTMWARVKGATENALLAMPFKAAYMFRPGVIQPLHGIVSKTPLYRALYVVTTPLFPLINLVAGKYVTTTEAIGKAMLRVVANGASKKWLENRDINELAASR